MKIEDWPILKSRGFQALYQFDATNDAATFLDGSTAHEARADQTWQLLRAAMGFADASAVIVRGDQQTSVASLKGGLVCEGEKSLNIGLFFPKLRDLDSVALEVPEFSPQIEGTRMPTLWAVCERLARCESARTLVLRIAGSEVALHAKRGRFDLVSGADSSTAFTEMLNKAIAAGEEVAYSLGEGREGDPKGDHGLSILFGEETGQNTWQFDQGGELVGCPNGANMSDISKMVAFHGRIVAAVPKGVSATVEVRSDSNAVVVKADVSQAGEVKVA
ncbi:hypothetical protein [Loktanella sp. S4079]|uniref:hypothetical protein n=1 Tax=Loktanella sp. S4079 TaxID=579483 RepID=UPI0005FA5837|nr:hypothetical protein [Loktanella sp. S4079]KJZ19872.1 hypothetical protein TW80_03055 [Loktanella sp. S4079]